MSTETLDRAAAESRIPFGPGSALRSTMVLGAPAPAWHAEFAWSGERGGPGLAVRYFRCSFDVSASGDSFRIHVSADARYRLWLDGRPLGFGPAKGTLARYHFETYELGPLLKLGRHVLAAEVRWFGENSPGSEVHSPVPGLLVQGPDQAALDTPGRWRVWVSRVITPDTTPYIGNAHTFLNHVEHCDTRQEPVGWRELAFDDQSWQLAVATGPAAETGCLWGVAPLRRLTPRDVPAMLEEPGRFFRTIAQRTEIEHRFGSQPQGWVLPAGAGGTLLLDVGHYVTAFPELVFQGGRDREVRVRYAEALGQWVGHGSGREWRKHGVRDDITRLDPHGYHDTVLLRGGTLEWEPFYWRAFRWLQLEIAPGDEPLTVRDARFRLCVHPQPFLAEFVSSDVQSRQLFEVSVRTLRTGAHEIYDDSPYFEQYSYIADARMEALGSLHLCNDLSLPRRTLQLFLDTLRADGLIDARVPCQYQRQTIPYFCLHWIMMVEDYWRWVGLADQAFVQRCLVAVDSILVYFRARLRADGFVGATGGWNMVDAAEAWPDGQPPAVVAGGSTYLTCLFIEALQVAVRLHEEAGVPGDARRWGALARELLLRVRSAAWDDRAGLFVEGANHREPPFSQHAQAAAINAGVATRAQAQRVLRRLCTDPSLIPAQSMQAFYLSRALEKLGAYHDWHAHVLAPWRTALGNGVTTWPEYPDPCRSDSHAWAAWPAVNYITTVLGIRPGAPGWTRIMVAPQTGGLDWAEGSAPTPSGPVRVSWKKQDGLLRFSASTPPGAPVAVHLPGCAPQEFLSGGDIAAVVPIEPFAYGGRRRR